MGLATTVDGHRASTVRRILDAASDLIGDGTPYTDVPMQQIAAHSGIARSTVYLTFPNKSQLLMALAEESTTKLIDAAKAWWARPHDDGPDGAVAAMRSMLAEFRNNQHVYQALSEVSAYDADVAEFWRARVAAFVEVVVARLILEKDAGTIDPEIEPRETALVLTWSVERALSLHCRHDSGKGDEAITQTLGRMIWLTVYGRTAA